MTTSKSIVAYLDCDDEQALMQEFTFMHHIRGFDPEGSPNFIRKQKRAVYFDACMDVQQHGICIPFGLLSTRWIAEA